MLMLFLSSCISVKVPLGPIEKIKNLKFTTPKAPFVELSTEESDYSWISETTGNTISILSECQVSRLRPKEMATDTLLGIEKAKILIAHEIEVSSHPAYFIKSSGTVDEHSVMIAILTVKASDCFVTVTYGGLEKNFSKEYELFDQLQASLVIP